MTISYLLNRVVQTVFVMFLVSIITFSFLSILPGDPVTLMLGPDAAGKTPAQLEQERHDLGLDRPIPIQYLDWMGGVLTGDWGKSITSHQPVTEAIKQRAPVTLELAVLAWAWSLAWPFPSAYSRL